jgi:hypothetical protein
MKKILAIVGLAAALVAANAQNTNLPGVRPPNGVAPPLVWGADPFTFPYAGTMRHRTAVVDPGSAWFVTLNPGKSFDVLNTTGSGVVRDIRFTIGQNDSDATEPDLDFTKHIRLNIKVDGESTASTTIPLCHLVGWLDLNNLTTNLYWSRWFRVQDIPKDNANGPAGGFILKYPIPYTNGIRIYVDEDGLEPGVNAQMMSEVTWQDYLPPCPNRNLRFFATNAFGTQFGWVGGSGTVTRAGTNITGSGTSFDSTMVGKVINDASLGGWDAEIITVADATHLTIAPNDTNNVTGVGYAIENIFQFLTRPAGRTGYVAAVYGSLSHSVANTTYFEANTRFRLNGETNGASWEFSATEEFFGGDFYFQNVPVLPNYGTFQNWEAGVLANPRNGGTSGSLKTKNIFAGYRLFPDNPPFYTNGITMIEPANMSNTALRLTNNWTTVFYEYR